MKTLTGPEMLEKALIYSAKKHKGQRRKGDGRPYILHPIAVMDRIRSAKSDSNNIHLLGTCALLHDTVEDCGVSIRKIAKKFGYSVASIVEELTLDKAMYKVMGKTQYLCISMQDMSSYALAIKLCDRLDNLSDMKTMSKDFQEKYFYETVSIINSLKTRKLTDTHIDLISQIKVELRKYGTFTDSYSKYEPIKQ